MTDILIEQIKTTEDFSVYKKHAIQEWAQDRTNEGLDTLEMNIEWSSKLFDEQLPNGIQTENNYLYKVATCDEIIVGYFWIIKTSKTELWVNDIEIFEKYRGNGYSHLIMYFIDNKCSHLGCDHIVLEVRAQNKIALNLYNDHGYRNYQIKMVKKINA